MKFVYGLIDPRTSLVRYIGLAISDKRPRQHRACLNPLWNRQATHKTNWIQELANAGFDYEICVLEECEEHELREKEIWWIAYGRACGWPLTNLTDGGDGLLNPSEETRAKLSQAASNRKLSEETKARIGAAGIGNTHLTGHKHSDETRDRMSVAAMGKKLSPEHRAKIAIASTGRRHSVETKLKIGEASKKRMVTS